MYGIRPGQIWKSIRYPDHFGDLKVLGFAPKSKTCMIHCIDLSTGRGRSLNAYNLARTGNYELSVRHDGTKVDRWYNRYHENDSTWY